jgi:hypothetical protein
MEQLSLFSNTAHLRPGARKEKPVMDASALEQWKYRIFNYQQQVRVSKAPQQGTLFNLAPSHCDSEQIDPFNLHLQSMAFYRMPDNLGQAALYFVIDSAAEILLYIGETKQSHKRWKGLHDCKNYIASYQDLNHRHNITTAVNISFWWDAPTDRKARQSLEQTMITKWRSPFNKEMWHLWGQPFASHK